VEIDHNGVRCVRRNPVRSAIGVIIADNDIAFIAGHGNHPQTPATTLVRLGDTHEAAGSTAAARDTWRQALVILEECGHPDAAGLRVRLRGRGRDRQPAAPTGVS
jgi:predicted TPR repeat methyltransferase